MLNRDVVMLSLPRSLLVGRFTRRFSLLWTIIEKVVIVPGTYHCRMPDGGAEDIPMQKAGGPWGSMRRSVAWLGAVATRALIYIKSDNADIGLICFIGVGMVEISTIREGQNVKAGSELGMFHYGGSTHIVIF